MPRNPFRGKSVNVTLKGKIPASSKPAFEASAKEMGYKVRFTKKRPPQSDGISIL